MSQRFVTALACAVVAACAGPRPSAPSASVVIAPAAWRDGRGGIGEVDAEWWKAFGDPVLTGLVAEALGGNDDLAIAAERVEEARAQLSLVRSDLSPRIDGSLGGVRQRDVGPFGAARVQTAAQPGVTIGYDVDLFGRLRDASAASAATLLATEDAREAVRLAVASSVASAYVTMRALDARLVVARATLTERRSALGLATRRARAGYSSALEMRQAEAEYHATEQIVPQTELAIVRQENALRVLLGRTPGTVPRGAPLADLTVPRVPAGLPADVLRRRPDVAQAERQIVAADRNLDSARAAFMPDVRLAGSGGAALSTLLADPVALWSIGGSILAPIFEGGRLRSQSDAAASRRNQAAFGYRRVALQAFREVEDGLAAADRTTQQLAAVAAQRIALAQAVRIASNRYDAGYAPYLDQLDAERGLLGSELAVIQAQSDRLLAAVSLFQAVGGGWRGDGADVTSPGRTP